ncbi:MAG: D-tyrosyl-tRNA(Tyr) deacylase [Flavobacteriaceae bacterium]|nr:D-tyrosyl-tRNA(Tyr) deacylase [Flavobacteriaceae bacterium]
MKLIIQRVKESSLEIENKIFSSIGFGMVVLIGISKTDNRDIAKNLADKISKLRIFNGDNGKMDKNIQEINGEVLVVSQFTLYADTKKGNRPSFISAAKPEMAVNLYSYFIEQLQKLVKSKIKTGKFGADMKVKLINDGPVTIILEK